MTHMGKSDATYEEARQAVIAGLEDDDTHIGDSPLIWFLCVLILILYFSLSTIPRT